MRVVGVFLVSAAALIAWSGVAPTRADEPPPSRLPAASNDEAWKQLPRKDPPLPSWARVLVRPLPQTTGTMLELDHLHRAKNPLDAALAAKLRWAAADALGCDYGRRYADADLRRAGLSDADLKKLGGDFRKLPAAERAACAFARKLTLAARTVTDAEVAELLDAFGPEKTAAIVHTVAYANFHDRILLALGAAVEADGPLPPLDAALDPEKRAKVAAPKRPAWTDLKGGADAPARAGPAWGERSFEDLTRAVERQKERKPRVPLPDAERLAALPPDAKARAEKIAWLTVSMGYQPRLTKAWFDCLRAFEKEADLDPVFANEVFWVVTRGSECFY
jgi:alkylhydroperoxidase family enzyme